MKSLPPALCLLAGFALPAPAADDAANTAFFESKIRPVLVKHCYECHSAEAGKSKGGLMLDTKHGIRTGGDSGAAVVPGDPAGSLLLAAIKHADPDLEMPPKEPRLADSIIADFETWIARGASDPRESAAKVAERPPVDVASGRQFWSYKRPALPHQAAGGIDGLIGAALKAHDLERAPEAEPVVVLRRLFFDLIGLPPSPEEVEAFLTAVSGSPELPEAELEKVVDRLLHSPHFGERWGRHWLDVVRYAESNGRESNLTFPHAWRYRDYVIDALNADVPFDRFITEQIAGDLLPAKSDAERARLLIATGFLAFGPKGLNEMNKAQFAADVADEQLDTVTRALMASSVACARCHDHKTEPFSMEDYYALAGIFKSTTTHFGNWIDSENNNHGHLIRLPALPGQLIPNKAIGVARVNQLKADLAKMEREEQAEMAMAAKAKAEGKELKVDYFMALRKAIGRYWSRGSIEGQLERVDAEGRALPLCMGVRDGTVNDSPIYDRGEIAHPGKSVRRAFPRVIQVTGVKTPPDTQSGRLELAQWFASSEHPLTARVMANRVWRHLFGAGLVRTVDNFGFSGERPSHPELLDYLAITFMERGWSLKALIKEVVLTRTYRQSSAHRVDAFDKDPDNRWLWRANKRRLDAEVIRDSMLAVSGMLDPARRPGSLVAELDGQSVSLIGFNTQLPPDLDGSRHRSIYLPVLRDQLPDVLEQFDVANPNLVTGDRDVTNVPLQALYLLNGPFVQEQAAALARRVLKEQPAQAQRIQRVFALCFNRPPDAQELKLADAFFRSGPQDEARQMAAYCHALLATAEFRFAD